MARKNTVNRPSRPHQEWVTDSTGRRRRNIAYRYRVHTREQQDSVSPTMNTISPSKNDSILSQSRRNPWTIAWQGGHPVIPPAGTSFLKDGSPNKETLLGLTEGQKLYFVHEPDNPYDPHAVSIRAVNNNPHNPGLYSIGYIPAKLVVPGLDYSKFSGRVSEKYEWVDDHGLQQCSYRCAIDREDVAWELDDMLTVEAGIDDDTFTDADIIDKIRASSTRTEIYRQQNEDRSSQDR